MRLNSVGVFYDKATKFDNSFENTKTKSYLSYLLNF